MAESIRFEPDWGAIDDIAHDAETGAFLLDVGNEVAASAARLAPKRTGAMAASIHAEVDEDRESLYADVSWDAEHFYGYFAEVGTEDESARPFLRPGLDATTI